MPDLSNWTYDHPSATSRLRDFPSGYRSDKSHTRAVWEEEHYFEEGSADSVGVHKPGSGRIRVEDDSADVPSVGTALGELTIGSATGRLYYTGSEAPTAQPLSTGTSFRCVVVGPRSIDTTECWVMSWRTADFDSSTRFIHHDNSAFGPYLEIPFMFISAVSDLVAANLTVIASFVSSVDSSGFTLGGFQMTGAGDNSLDTALDSATLANILTIGRMNRSVFS